MKPRIKNPAGVVPNAMAALMNLAKIAESSTIPPRTLSLVHLTSHSLSRYGQCRRH